MIPEYQVKGWRKAEFPTVGQLEVALSLRQGVIQNDNCHFLILNF